ncbi:MAG: class I SAM-dependent methyltransferase [Myxococcota bacterium]
MAERAHPDLDGFRDRWRVRWRFGVVPWPERYKNPYRAEVLWRYRWVGPFCEGKDVLDVPCGMGWGTSLIRGTRSIIGLDISERAVQEARSRYGTHASFRVGSMDKLDFPDATFDTIVCLEGIEHVPKPVARSFVTEARRVLRPSGQLLLSSPHPRHGTHSGNPYHAYEYPPEEMRALLETRFDVVDVSSRGVDELIIHYFHAKKPEL